MSDYTVVFGDIVRSTSSRLSSVADLLRTLDLTRTDAPKYSNTWGDAFVAVFDSATSAVRYALSIRDGVRVFDWRATDVFRTPMLRIAVDAGSLDWSYDDLRKDTAPTGLALATGARIEASAAPGDVRVTTTVKGLLRHADSEFFFEPLGAVELPKKFGALELFRAHWAHERRSTEESRLGPLQDDQHFHRLAALRRFAMMWLILDQLPRGGWGRSVEPWMHEVWKDDPTVSANPLISDEGGFETTVLNLGLLAELIGPRQLVERFSRAFRYLDERHTPRGFGALSLSREGYGIEPHARHTALAGWLFGRQLREYSLVDPNFRDQFRTAALALFDGDAAEAFSSDRNPIMLYVAAWHVVDQISSAEWAPMFRRAEIESVTLKWKALEPALERLALRLEYKGRLSDGSLETISLGSRIAPYGGFRRMEAYTLLTAAAFGVPTMPREIVSRLRLGTESVLDEYLVRFGQAEDRYTRDPLVPAPRGAFPYGGASGADLGTSGLLLRVLRGPARDALWPDGLDLRYQRARHLLEEDLAELFDRYTVEPGLYALTNAGMLASMLIGDHQSAIRAVWDACRDITKAAALVEMTTESLDQVLSEHRLADLVDHIVGGNVPPPGIQMSTYSLIRLLVDRVRPGRYIKERLDESGIRIVAKRTIAVYSDKTFCETYDRTWGDAPDRAIAAPFLALLQPVSRVLDVGCGPGQYARLFAAAGHCVDILDASPLFLDAAKGRLEAVRALPSKAYLSDIVDPGARSVLAELRYDAIWCSGPLAHLPQASHPEVLRWMYDILTDDGCLFVNFMVGNAKGFARDGRYFSYVDRADEVLQRLVRSGFTTELMIERIVRRNTHREANFATRWMNYYARKRRRLPAEDDCVAAVNLTQTAYDRSVSAFVEAHRVLSRDRVKFIEAELQTLARFCGENRTLEVLDAGCGPGDFAVAMERQGWRVVGVDTSIEMVRHARQMVTSGRGTLAFYVGDMTELAESWTERFDAVLCVTALQHVPVEGDRLRAALRQFRRVLKPGGVVRVDARIGAESGFETDGRFVQKFERQEVFQEHLESAGFDVLQVKPDILPPGVNSFRRPIALKYARFWARKGT